MVPDNPYGGGKADFTAQAFLIICVLVFWAVVTATTVKQAPVYMGELKAIAQTDWISMWTWIDYGNYYRYSPTALLPVGLLDRDYLAPLLGIEFPSERFASAHRLVPLFVFLIVFISLMTYRFCRRVSLGIPAALVAGLFIGLNKGFAYYFRYASTVATLLLLVYTVFLLIFAVRYLHSRRLPDLAGYYLSLFLAVGSWEQWINLLGLLIVGSLILAVHSGRVLSKPILIHGLFIPLTIGVIYIALHAPTISSESNSIKEAQYVFSYPTRALMAEDMAVNASLHIASIVEPILFPWRMLSQSVLKNQDMDVHNAYNKIYTPYSTIHYRGMGDWYAGLLGGLFLAFTAVLLVYIAKHRKNALPALLGIILTYAGFAVHLPVMYRTYFVLPGYVSLLDYKHALSILGFSILLGWGSQAVLDRVKGRSGKIMFCLALCSWFAYCNYTKISQGYHLTLGVFPW